jgi:hypothetical protein
MRTLHQLQEGLPDVDAVADIIGEARVAIAVSLESLERAQTLLLKASEPARPRRVTARRPRRFRRTGVVRRKRKYDDSADRAAEWPLLVIARAPRARA